MRLKSRSLQAAAAASLVVIAALLFYESSVTGRVAVVMPADPPSVADASSRRAIVPRGAMIAVHPSEVYGRARRKPQTARVLKPLGAGRASFYGFAFAGRSTASGEVFDPAGLTAAHPDLPFNSRVRVTNVDNGRSVVVRVNDRGPFTGGRIIDVSRAAARELRMIQRGVANVRIDLVE